MVEPIHQNDYEALVEDLSLADAYQASNESNDVYDTDDEIAEEE